MATRSVIAKLDSKGIKAVEESDFDSQFKKEVISTRQKVKAHLEKTKLELEEKIKNS